ncbi:MAG TPA: hypothetical protein VHP58_06255 [Alphaproteobacteria bacterium]|nr:hypothetical protein [Alphaproteobacteria bacterium]
MNRRSAFVAGAAGVMVLILLMALMYVYKNVPANAPEHAVASIAANISNTMLLPPPVTATGKTVPTRPVARATNTRAVIAIQKPKPTVVKFSSIEDTFTGTWAPYPRLCDTAYYSIHDKSIRSADGNLCAVNHTMGSTGGISATVVLDCQNNNYAGRETWNISQPRPGALSIRQNGGNAVSLISCDNPQVASN